VYSLITPLKEFERVVVPVVNPADSVPDGDVVGFGGGVGGPEVVCSGVVCPAIFDRYLLVQRYL